MLIPHLNQLNQRFGCNGAVQFRLYAEHYPIVLIDNSLASASIALQGGHLMTYQPRGQEPVIWLSNNAKFAPGKSIRGGVPICWPWFGPHAQDASKPGHGHARTVPWEVLETAVLDSGATQIRLQLQDSSATCAFWAHNTPVQVLIEVGSELRISLITHNAETQPIIISEALHTYFYLSEIANVQVRGLEGAEFVDKVAGTEGTTEEAALLISSEVDRVYLNTTADCLIEDTGFKRRIRIHKNHSQSTVVWNPWIEKAEKMGDLGEQGYRRMLCVESANALQNSVEIAPGASHSLSVVYSLEALS